MKLFSSVPSLNVRRTPFNLSYSKKFTTDMGKLIPILCEEAVPGDIWKIGNEVVIRFQPLLAPILHEVNVYVHYFFVPYRLLWNQWEDFITGGEDGTFTASLPSLNTNPPSSWSDALASGNLFDYLYNLSPDSAAVGSQTISAFPMYAYNFIWNEYYRDENVDDEVELYNYNIFRRRWKKDYFTSSLPFRQRGVSPALPVTVTIPSSSPSLRWSDGTSDYYVDGDTGSQTGVTEKSLSLETSASAPADTRGQFFVNVPSYSAQATSFDISDLRLAFQVQKWLERSARCGARYTEQLRAHFGVSPRDDRLQRPEYIGGTKAGVVFSEVLQTSASQSGQTKQGNMAGHGLAAAGNFAGKYKVYEYGLVMGIMSVVPKSTYSTGVNRQWLRETKYDFYFPEFAHLSEQAIQFRELWDKFGSTSSESNNPKGIFGYQGRYDEMRYKPSTVHSGMRTTFDYWHLSREFSDCPHLNSEFLECNPSKRIFAVQNEDGLIVNFFNKLRVVRPLPAFAEPGLVDHF